MNKKTNKITKKELEKIIKEKADLFLKDMNSKISSEEFKIIIEKCITANAINFSNTALEKEIKEKIKNWYEKKFKPFIFEIDLKTYSKAVIEALKIQFLIAGTDFSSSRQRDLGQKWADTIRGYLGEFGVKKWIERNYPYIKIYLGHEQGLLEEYLPQDIHKIEKNRKKRNPRIKVSIKSTKFNGIWMDIPGNQFNHSDVFILTKLFVSNDHLFSFFKEISVFKDKILKCGIEENCIDEKEAENIFNQIPSFKPIIGYIPGFIIQKDYMDKNPSYKYEYIPKKTKAYIYNYEGEYDEKILEKITKEIKSRHQNINKITFEGIGNFGKQHKYIFGMKSLKYTKDDWKNNIIDKL